MLRAMVGFCHFPTAALCRALLRAEQQVCPAIDLTVFLILSYPYTYVSTSVRYCQVSSRISFLFISIKNDGELESKAILQWQGLCPL